MAGINEFKQKIESDAAFKESLQKSADAREFMDKIKAAGFEITPEELADIVNGKGAEVNDEELEAVAGGSIDDFREMWANRKIIDREKEKGKNVEEFFGFF